MIMGLLRCRKRVLDDASAPHLQVGRVALRFLKPRLAGQAADRLVKHAVGRPALRAVLHPEDEAPKKSATCFSLRRMRRAGGRYQEASPQTSVMAFHPSSTSRYILSFSAST